MNKLISDWFWERLSLYIGWLAMVVLFALVMLAANIEIKDLDIWLHLASGRYILEHFSIPTTDIFSATVYGQPWINHEWLFQVCLYSVYALYGVNGLITLQVMLVGVTFLILLFLGYNRERQVMPIAALFLVVLVYQLRFFLRPDIFSLLLFLLYICVLSMKLHSRASLVIIFLLQLLWTNIHGFFILGPFLVVLSIAAEWIKRQVKLPFEMNAVGRLNSDEFRNLLLILPASLAACLFNPHFVQGALYPLEVFFSFGQDADIFFKHIVELEKPFGLVSFFDLGNYLFYKLLIMISAISFILNYRKIDIGLFLFWLFFLIFSASAARNVAYFAFVAYFVILANGQHIHFSQFFSPRLDTTRFKMICSIVIKAVLIWAMLNYIQARSVRGYYDFDRYERKSEHGGLSLRNYPAKAVDFLVKNGIEGKFFNDFNAGAYLIGRASPRIKVFIDGRTELYGGAFFERYHKAWKGNTVLFDQLVDQYGLTGAFLSSVYVPAPQETIRHLYESPQWSLVYFDYDATIFLKNVAANQEWISRYKIDLSKREVEPADLLKIKGARVTPYRYTNRAQTYYNLRLFDQAGKEAREALRMNASDPTAFKVLGKVALREKHYEQALQQLLQAKNLNPGDIEGRFYLSVAYYHLDELALAQENLQRVLQAQPENPLGLLLLSKIYQKLGQDERAAGILKKIEELAPGKLQHLTEEIE